MHAITGFYFVKNTVIYSSIVENTRYATVYNRTGLTDEQAKGKFIIEHLNEVDNMVKEKKRKEGNSKIILTA